MNKKLVISIMAIIMSLQMGGSIFANEIQGSEMRNNTVVENAEIKKGNFIIETGVVCNIDGNQNNYTLQVGSIEEGTIFNLQEDIIVFDVADKKFLKPDAIKKGMKVSVVYPKDAPMMLSLPARCGAAQLVIIHDESENVQMGYFDENLVNEENTLALNVSEKTVIMNNIGERRVFVADDIKNKDAMVVYTVTTRSIPAQTTPSFVLIMENTEREQDKDLQIRGRNAIENKEVTYVSLRTVAEKNGFEVNWDNSTKTATLTKGDIEYCFVVGENTYLYNKEEKKLEHPIILKDGSVEIADHIFN